jgi:hypothetical protein
MNKIHEPVKDLNPKMNKNELNDFFKTKINLNDFKTQKII